MVVTELQGISPMALIDKLSFLHARRSKRRALVDEVKAVLMAAVAARAGQREEAHTLPLPTAITGEHAHPSVHAALWACLCAPVCPVP